MKSLSLKIALFSVVLPALVSAQGGQSGLSFLKLGIGARSLAMGEAAVAISTDPSATHYNPAALRLAAHPQLLIMHKQWIQGSATEFLAASVPLDAFSFALFLNATSVSDIEIRQRPGPAEGTFTSRNAALGLSTAYSIDSSLSIGATVKYLYEKIFVDETQGLAFDLGAVYSLPWDVVFGASVTNIGSMGVLKNESTKLPATVRLGAAHSQAFETLDGEGTIALELVSFLPEKNTHLYFGAEFIYDELLAIRAGYMSGYETRNFTAGLGFRYQFINVDYAFVPFRLDLGSTHTISLGIEF